MEGPVANLLPTDLNVFNDIGDFLHPDKTFWPLVELPRSLNPFQDQGVRIFAKLCGGNIKMLPALNLLFEAQNAGKLKGVHTVIDNSSGGFAAALGIFAPRFGIRRVKAIISKDTPPLKMERLRLLGVDYAFADTDEGSPNGIEEAKRKGRQQGWFCTDQYADEGNPRAYEKWFAPHLWDQTEGNITLFVAGMGTCGTVVGTGRFLKKVGNVTVVGITPATQQVPGVRTYARLVSNDWRDVLDSYMVVDHQLSYKNSLGLLRAGIWGGPSSGLAYTGLCRFLEKTLEGDPPDMSVNKPKNPLDPFLNKSGEVVAVFPCPDSPDLYGEKYSTHLDPEQL